VLSRRQFLIGLGATASTTLLRSSPTAIAAAATTSPATSRGQRLIATGRAQIGVTVSYDPAYFGLRYPMGDVPRDRGVCTDVIVRAYRDAFGVDLQELVHNDMRASFSAYPKSWGLRRPDPNIDHRRVLNLATFWRRHGETLTFDDPAEFRPGDLVTQMIGGRLPHLVIVSDRVLIGQRLAIHNIGAGTQENGVLYDHTIIGRFRYRL
jgi:uncharacterized protein